MVKVICAIRTVLNPSEMPNAMNASIREIPVTISAFSMGILVMPMSKMCIRDSFCTIHKDRAVVKLFPVQGLGGIAVHFFADGSKKFAVAVAKDILSGDLSPLKGFPEALVDLVVPFDQIISRLHSPCLLYTS